MLVQDEISLEQGELQADVEVVRRYGDAHPRDWVEVRFENQPSVRIVALFAGDELDVHRDALCRLVAHPNQLEVRASPWPRVRLEEIRSEIEEMALASERGLFNGWGTGGGRVTVRLRADCEPLASQLQERYGRAVDLTVGFLHFPECVFLDAKGWRVAYPAQPRPMPLPDELHVAVDDALEVRSGANLRSGVRLTNEGVEEVVVHTNGQLTAWVLDLTTNETVGGFAGAQTLPLIRFAAPAGGSVEIPLLIGTASIAPRLGYPVPAGRWAIEMTLGLGARGAFRTAPIPLDVVA